MQYCCFLKQVGQKERAVASYQAVLEFNLLCPLSLENAVIETKMAAFEVFWDECRTKLGTSGALGWKNHEGKYPQSTAKAEGIFYK